MPFQKGNKIGNRFTMDKQPEKSGRPVGVRNRGTTTKMVFDMVGVLPDKIFESLKQTVPGIEKSMNLEQIIDTIQAFKAITEKDTQAAKYLKDNLYGFPKQDVEVESRNTINIKIE